MCFITCTSIILMLQNYWTNLSTFSEKSQWIMIGLAKPLSQPAWASSVTSAENSLLCVLHRFCAQTGAGKFTVDIYVTPGSLALHKLTNKCVTVQNRNLHHLIVWNHLKQKVAQTSVFCSCAQTLEYSLLSKRKAACECTWQESLLCPQTSLSWIIEQWIISRLTCIRSFQLRIIKLPLNPLLLNKSLSWKNRRCVSRGKLWLDKVLSRKSYGGVFLGDGACHCRYFQIYFNYLIKLHHPQDQKGRRRPSKALVIKWNIGYHIFWSQAGRGATPLRIETIVQCWGGSGWRMDMVDSRPRARDLDP